MLLAGIFEYSFMQRAFLAGILLALVIPCIGIIVVLKRLSLIGDALSHTSLAGVAAGLLFNINPIIAAIFACIAATLSIEFISKKLPKYSELSIAIILSAGIGLAGVFSGMLDTPANFNSFLFGSIVAISDTEIIVISVLAVSVLLTFLLLFRELFYMAFNERLAKLSGVPVKITSFVFTVMTAVTVAIASRTVGALIVSSLMVVPVAAALQFSQNYKKTLLISIVLAEAFTVGGLILSYYQGLRPG
ncbi:MAG: metal ABC transporter permease, partial [Clostridia bacterium]